jgi:hypothetical protein
LLVAAVGVFAWQRMMTTPSAPKPLASVIVPPPHTTMASAPMALPAARAVEAPVVDATATMEVTTTPAGATLVLDGKTLHERSPARLTVAAGAQHVLQVRTSSRGGVAQRFMLDAGEEATMEIDLRKSEHAAVKRSAHTVHASATTAKANAGPAATSSTASPPPPVAPSAKREGDGHLVIASSPWCTVTVDGQARGTTPLDLKLKAGSHQVVLANPEYKIRRTLAVDIEPNQTVRKSLDFAPE